MKLIDNDSHMYPCLPETLPESLAALVGLSNVEAFLDNDPEFLAWDEQRHNEAIAYQMENEG